MQTPSPAELAAGLGVTGPRTAVGSVRWEPVENCTWNFGWAGTRPVMVDLPAGVDVRFTHAAPNRWRVDGPDGPVARVNSRRAVAWDADGCRTGGSLLLFGGPDSLLRPSGREAVGTVEPDELIGRPCWRWATGDATLWVDDASGVLLRLDDEHGSLAFTALTLDEPVPSSRFRLPRGLPESEPFSFEPAAVLVEPPLPETGFTVPWWPLGTAGRSLAGDAEVPWVLLELAADPPMRLAVGPAGQQLPKWRGAHERRWDGDAWTFALSWCGDVAAHEVDRIVASIPREWA